MPPKQHEDAGGEPQVRAEHEITAGGLKVYVKMGDICCDDSDAIVNAADEAMQHGGGVAGAIVAAGGQVIQKESDEWVAEHGRVATGGGVAVTSSGSLPCKHVIHVVGPIWREPIEGETLARGEVVSIDGKGGLTVVTEECGKLAVPFWAVAGGYSAEEGDRIRLFASRKAGPKGSRGEFVPRYCSGTKFKPSASDEELLKGAVAAALAKADEMELSSVSLPAISSGVFGFPLAKCAETMVSAVVDFAASAKSVRAVSFTNRNAGTVASFVNAFTSRFGAQCVNQDAAKAATSKSLVDGKGRELKGPLLLTVDASGSIISKEPCPPTTVAKQRELKAAGFFFHSAGEHKNNWVKGMPPPADPIQARTFNPSGDWSSGGYGTNTVIPGMSEEGPSKAKKKSKKKSGGGGVGGAGGGEDSDDTDKAVEPSHSGGDAKKEVSGKEEVAKRIKAVGKKLRQAEDLRDDRAGGKELNVDQLKKIETIDDMKREMAELEDKLNSL